MKKVLSMLFLALIAFLTFSACSNDEEDAGLNDPNYIIGTWQEVYNGGGTGETYTFNKDNTVRWTQNKNEFRGTYEYKAAGPNVAFVTLTMDGVYENGSLVYTPSEQEREYGKIKIQLLLFEGNLAFSFDDGSGHEMKKIK